MLEDVRNLKLSQSQGAESGNEFGSFTLLKTQTASQNNAGEKQRPVESSDTAALLLPGDVTAAAVEAAASNSPPGHAEVPSFSNISPTPGILATPTKTVDSLTLVTPQKIDFVSSMRQVSSPARFMRNITEKLGVRACGDANADRSAQFMSALDTPTKEAVIGIESMAQSLSSRKRTLASRASTPKRPCIATPGKSPGTPQSVRHLQMLAASPDWSIGSVGSSSPLQLQSPSPKKRCLQPILPKPSTSQTTAPNPLLDLRSPKTSPRKLRRIAPKTASPVKQVAAALLTKARTHLSSPDKQQVRFGGKTATPVLGSSKRRIFPVSADEEAANVASEREIGNDQIEVVACLTETIQFKV